MKVAHFADTHIYNLKHHEELREVFSEIDKSLERHKPDIIVHAGDVVDGKISMSPELISMVVEFFLMLSKHAKVLIVPGNHDGLIHNTNRMISLKPIIETINNNNIVLMDDTSSIRHKGFSFSSLSIFGKQEEWETVALDEAEVNVGIYHGTVGVVRTDSNFQMEGEVSLDVFSKFDFLMLGHIHYAQKVDKEGRAQYSGSTMQSSYDESPLKGYLLWHIENKSNFTVEPQLFLNPRPFQTIQIMNANELINGFDGFSILPKCRLKVIVNDPNFSLTDEDFLKKFLRGKINYYSVQFIKGAGAKRNDVEEAVRAIELNKLEVQQSLISDHLIDVLNIKDQKLICDVLDTNAKLFAEEDVEEYVLKRNTSFAIKKIGWSNFFSYGYDNEIDFEEFPDNGIIGIFGENFSGKSSVVDVLCFVLWNDVTKDIQKSSEIMRFGTKECSAYVVFEHGGKQYKVERGLKKSKSGATKSELEFCVLGEDNKLEDKKQNTDKEISTFTGEMQDFLMTSFMSQFSGMMFVNEKSAARREILKRILNLGVFDKRIEKINKEIYFLDRKRKDDYQDGMDDEVKNMQEKIASIDVELDYKRALYKELDAQVNEFQKFDLMVVAEKESLKQDENIELSAVDVSPILKLFFDKKEEIVKLNCVDFEPILPRWFKKYSNMQELSVLIAEKQGQIADIGAVKDKLVKSVFDLEKTISEHEAKNIDEKIPCLSISENMVNSCSLAEYYVLSKETTNKNKEELASVKNELAEVEKNRLVLVDLLQSEVALLIKRLDAWVRFNKNIEKHKNNQAACQALVRSLDKVVYDYKLAVRRNKNFERNQMKRERLLLLEQQNRKNLYKFADAKKQRDVVLNEGTMLRDQKAALLERLKVVFEKEAKFQEDLYRTTVVKTLQKVFVGNSGLTISIMKKFIPLINMQANEILSQMSDIVVKLETTEKDTLELTFINGDGEDRSVGTSSGAERTMISIALRMALVAITSLPVANLFVLDEPATAFDEKRLEEFEKVLMVVKTRFEHVVLITHINMLKDFVDSVMRVDKKDGISCLSVEV